MAASAGWTTKPGVRDIPGRPSRLASTAPDDEDTFLFANAGYGAVLPTVFANLVQLITGRPATPEIGRHAFVEDVRVSDQPVRNPAVMRLIAWCWVLIAVKHVVIIWLVWRYHIPIHQLWINFPTWMLGVLATAVYYGRTRRA
jgi:hypothetical protein